MTQVNVLQSHCGDGKGQCDDGNDVDGDGCSSDCKVTHINQFVSHFRYFFLKFNIIRLRIVGFAQKLILRNALDAAVVFIYIYDA